MLNYISLNLARLWFNKKDQNSFKRAQKDLSFDSNLFRLPLELNNTPALNESWLKSIAHPSIFTLYCPFYSTISKNKFHFFAKARFQKCHFTRINCHLLPNFYDWHPIGIFQSVCLNNRIRANNWTDIPNRIQMNLSPRHLLDLERSFVLYRHQIVMSLPESKLYFSCSNSSLLIMDYFSSGSPW